MDDKGTGVVQERACAAVSGCACAPDSLGAPGPCSAGSSQEPPDPVAFAKALADETRQQIMGELCCVWRSVGEVVAALDERVNQPTVSHHLRILRDAGLVRVRREGRQRFYTLNQERLTVCCGRLISTFAPQVAGRVLRAAPQGAGAEIVCVAEEQI